MKNLNLTAVIEPEGSGFNALCPELDIASQGFMKVRQKGSHAVMQTKIDGISVTVPVPLHDEIRTGTLRSIIRQSGLTRHHFEVRIIFSGYLRVRNMVLGGGWRRHESVRLQRTRRSDLWIGVSPKAPMKTGKE